MGNIFFTAIMVVVAMMVGEPIFLGLLRLVGFYTIVQEREARVYVLFGKVLGVLDQPGLEFLWARFGWKALLLPIVGQCYVRDLSLDQEYLRSTPVNSEEGAPMGIGVWYEMQVSDPVAHVFRNTDPRGSLRANVGNAAVRCLSNLRLSDMLENRHAMSQSVRTEVSPQSKEWGYQLGSVYIRKVHFRDIEMIRQIEEKVVNRLRQVTSAIRQDGANQVNIIASTAEREAAVEFAKAAAMRPQIVGDALRNIWKDPAVGETIFEILENQRLMEGDAELVLIPSGNREDLLTQFATTAPLTPGGGNPLPPKPKRT
jgi:regulator of protease activity HflC (stomatin/prohibitin superfamily)